MKELGSDSQWLMSGVPFRPDGGQKDLFQTTS